MVTKDTLRIAKATAEELRLRGEHSRTEAIDALVQAVRDDAVSSLDLMTTTETGDLFGVSAQTIKNWVRQGRMAGYRVGSRIMIPKDAVSAYVRQAGLSLDLEVLSDDEAAELACRKERHDGR